MKMKVFLILTISIGLLTILNSCKKEEPLAVNNNQPKSNEASNYSAAEIDMISNDVVKFSSWGTDRLKEMFSSEPREYIDEGFYNEIGNVSMELYNQYPFSILRGCYDIPTFNYNLYREVKEFTRNNSVQESILHAARMIGNPEEIRSTLDIELVAEYCQQITDIGMETALSSSTSGEFNQRFRTRTNEHMRELRERADENYMAVKLFADSYLSNFNRAADRIVGGEGEYKDPEERWDNVCKAIIIIVRTTIEVTIITESAIYYLYYERVEIYVIEDRSTYEDPLRRLYGLGSYIAKNNTIFSYLSEITNR